MSLSGRPHESHPRRRRTMPPAPAAPITGTSRPAPSIVRGRPHPAYCARAASSAQTTATTPTNERAPDGEQRHPSPWRWRWPLLADSNRAISARAPPSNEGTAPMSKGTAPAPLTAASNKASWPRLFSLVECAAKSNLVADSLTVALSGERHRRRQAKALYPHHRHPVASPKLPAAARSSAGLEGLELTPNEATVFTGTDLPRAGAQLRRRSKGTHRSC